jgi:hypothetical protein
MLFSGFQRRLAASGADPERPRSYSLRSGPVIRRAPGDAVSLGASNPLARPSRSIELSADSALEGRFPRETAATSREKSRSARPRQLLSAESAP